MQYTIPRGQEFYCEFVIKEPGSGTPMDMTGGSGVFNLSEIGVNPCLVLADVPMVVEDGINGVISVTLTAEQTAPLIGRRGFAEDGYPIIPTYRATLDMINAEALPINVEIPQVYISDGGETCPA